MSSDELSPKEARRDLYEIMRGDASFEEKGRDALELGRRYLDADNAHLTRVDPETDHWEALVSTDPPDGQFPPGLELDFETTYCRRTVAADSPIALHDAPSQGWDDDPAFETHGIHLYHGTTIVLEDEPYGTVCFVAEDPREEPFGDGETMFAELVTRLLERELERDRHEAELTRRVNLVNVLNRVLRHNLRNGMAVIQGRTQMMAERLRDDENCSVTLRKIDELIDLSQKARELEEIVGQDLEHQQTDVAALVERVVRDVRSEFPSASITVESDDEVTAAVLPSFERAVREVVENAAEHAGESPTVTVTVETVPNAVAVRVADDGPGLSRQEREVLDTGIETPLVHGSGLGLWTVHWIVTSHDGSIETTVDEGTTMTISVPRSPDADASDQVVELRQARDRYQAAFEDAFEGMVIIDDDARIVESNPEASEIYGMDRQDLLGRSIPEFLPDDFDAVWAAFKEAGRVRDTVTVEGADGVDRTIQFSAVADVVPGQHLIVGRDVTERVERESQLNTRTRAMEAAPIGITITDPGQDDNPIVYANERFYELTGYDEEEVLGRNCRFLQGEATSSESTDEIRRALAAGEPTSVVLRNYRKDGTEFWNRLTLAPVEDEDGEITNYVGFQEDVTERVEQRRRFEALSNGFPDLCFVVDDEGVFREVLSNSDLDETLYVEPAEFLDEPVEEVLPPEQADLIVSMVQAAIETGQPRTFKYELDVPAGRRLFEARVAPLSIDIDSKRTVSCVVRDITERVDRADEIAET